MSPDVTLSDVVNEVLAEVLRQQERYGADNAVALDGTGPDVVWATAMGNATYVEAMFRKDYEDEDNTGNITWMHLVREEIAEAFKEEKPRPLTTELTQAAGLIINWIYHVHRRG